MILHGDGWSPVVGVGDEGEGEATCCEEQQKEKVTVG